MTPPGVTAISKIPRYSLFPCIPVWFSLTVSR
uniref:Uncharacterized protein n=1 Tax=Arundo donax TaxID=35708 RepID=A0A0A8Z4E7_ARUDO